MAEELDPWERSLKFGSLHRPGIGLIAFTLLVLVVLIAAIVAFAPPGGEVVNAVGTLYINDAGESHGGFEYAGSFDAVLSFDGRSGTLTFTLRIGLGDPLGTHKLRVRAVDLNETVMTLKTSAGTIVMHFQEEDEIWGDMFERQYVAVRAPERPEQDIGEMISPTKLGLPSHYYVQLGLVPVDGTV